MTEILPQYTLFLAKTVTLVTALLVVLVFIGHMRHKKRDEEHIEVRKLNDRYQRMGETLKTELLPKRMLKRELQRLKHDKKQDDKRADDQKKRVFVLNFHGDIKASALNSLREEITAVIMVARPQDEVFVRLESSGGMVHAYGLATSQLERLKHHGIPLTVSVDKVAASGGYMMACVADKIITAPFAIIGSIGVIAQLPNFNRLLKKNNVDFEQITAGEHKRTLTLFGENTDSGREKLKQEIEDTHSLFKELIAEYRSDIELPKVATGEYWYGRRAVDLKLVDELKTSDDYLLDASKEADVYEITFIEKKKLGKRLFSLMPQALERLRLT